MPIGGNNGIGWDETTPPVSEGAGLGATRIQSAKSSIRQVVAAEHNMSSAGGDSQGYHIYGSARPFYGPQSAVSSSGSDGRLMMTSDTSRLFGVGSAGTQYLGGAYGLSVGTTTGISWPQRAVWQVEFGQGITGSSGSTLVTIPSSGFSGLPFLQVTTITGIGGTDVRMQAVPVDAASFVVNSIGAGATFLSSVTFHWQSTGTRAL